MSLVMELSLGRKVRIHKGGRRRMPKTTTDWGTPQAQARRILAVGGQPVPVYGNDGETLVRMIDARPEDKRADTALAQCPLGIYVALGRLSADPEEAKALHAAGMYFRYCYGVTFGRIGGRSNCDLSTGGQFETDDKKLALVEGIYREMATLLRREREVFNAVWNVCVADQMVGPWHVVKLREGLAWIARNRGKISDRVKRRLDTGAD